MRLLLALAAGVALGACATMPEASPEIVVRFEDQGARRLADALVGPSLTEAQARSLLEVHGVAAMVGNATRYIPEATRERFVPDMVAYTAGQHDLRSTFALRHVAPKRNQMLNLLDRLAMDREAIANRIVGRLRPYAPVGTSAELTVHLIAGGVSDGFVDNASPHHALYLAADRANGDAIGVEQNATHELAQELQKIAGARDPQAHAFFRDFENRPAAARSWRPLYGKGAQTSPPMPGPCRRAAHTWRCGASGTKSSSSRLR